MLRLRLLRPLKGMVNYISDIRSDLGATQNCLNHTINNLSVMEENIQDAESTIRDTDVAEEMMAYTKNNILIQSAQAMLAHQPGFPGRAAAPPVIRRKVRFASFPPYGENCARSLAPHLPTKPKSGFAGAPLRCESLFLEQTA